MRLSLSLGLACLIVFTLATQALAKDPFEKTTWKIKAEPAEGDGKAFDDTLTFKGSKFESKMLKDKGFEAATYEDNTTRAGLGGFKATQKSDKEGEAVWTGTVTATEMKGELKWTKKDGSVVSYTFTGSRKDD
jgi:hypothetical protein